jgi:hypothetical protein
MLPESAQLRTSLRESFEPPFDSHRHKPDLRSERPGFNVSKSLPRLVRIERKVELVRRRLDVLGAGVGDSRRGLAQMAAVRADEVLIDGILASLGRKGEPGALRRGGNACRQGVHPAIGG